MGLLNSIKQSRHRRDHLVKWLEETFCEVIIVYPCLTDVLAAALPLPPNRRTGLAM